MSVRTVGFAAALLPFLFAARPGAAVPFPADDARVRPFLLWYGPWSPGLVPFVAQNFPLVVARHSNPDVAAARAAHPQLRVLFARDAAGIHPTDPDWGATGLPANLSEPRFLHAGNAASLRIEVGDGALRVRFGPDRRSTMIGLSGYRVYRATSPTGPWTPLATLPPTTLDHLDSPLPNYTVFHYQVRSLDGSGAELPYSGPDSAAASPVFALPQLVDSQVGLNPGPTPGAVVSFSFAATVSGTASSASVHVDWNADHVFQPSETLAMSYSGAGLWTATVPTAVPAGYLGGYAYAFSADGTFTRLPYAPASYTTSENNRVRDRQTGAFRLNPAEPSAAGYLAQRVSEQIAGFGFDGVLAGRAFGQLAPPVLLSAFDSLPYDYDPMNWNADLLSLFQSVRSALGAGAWMVFDPLDGVSQAYLAAADGAMIPGFARSASVPGGFQPLQVWQSQMSAAIAADLAFPGRVVLFLSTGPDTDIASRIYAVASYLIARGGRGLFSYGPDFAVPHYYPEWDALLGAPSVRYTPTPQATPVDFFLDPATGLYKREYENGVVYVNPLPTRTPGNPGATVNLSSVHYRVVPVGGVVPALGGNGSLSLVAVTQVVVSPNEGVILLRPTGTPTAPPTAPAGPSATSTPTAAAPANGAVVPNPAASGAELLFVYPAGAPARVEVWNLAGERVGDLRDDLGAGRIAFRPPAAGVYVWRLTRTGVRHRPGKFAVLP